MEDQSVMQVKVLIYTWKKNAKGLGELGKVRPKKKTQVYRIDN